MRGPFGIGQRGPVCCGSEAPCMLLKSKPALASKADILVAEREASFGP
jgi:hypothetical protein